MHRVLKTANPGVKENCHGKLAAGQRPRDHNSGSLKSMNDVGIHNLVENVASTSPKCKSPNVQLRHAGPTSVNREAELEPPSRVACSERLCEKYFGE